MLFLNLIFICLLFHIADEKILKNEGLDAFSKDAEDEKQNDPPKSPNKNTKFPLKSPTKNSKQLPKSPTKNLKQPPKSPTKTHSASILNSPSKSNKGPTGNRYTLS